MASAVPPLLAVRLVFGAKTQLVDVPHLIETVSLFLDTSVDVPPLQACKLGSVKLLDRIWNSSEVYTQDSNAVTNGIFALRKFLRTDRHYQQYFFTSALQEAVPSKKLGVVKWISNKFPTFPVSSEIVAKACLAGALDILQFFHDNCTQVLEKGGKFGVGHPVEWGNLTLSAAILGRRSDIVWWLHRHFPDANYNLEIALEAALKTGDISTAEWLLNQGAEWLQRARYRTCIDACYVAGQGRLDVLQWLNERGRVDSGNVEMLVNAAKGGHVEVVRWLIKRRGSSTEAVADAMLATHAAAIRGHLEVAKFLREFTKEVGGSPTSELLDCIEYRRELCKFDVYTVSGETMRRAAKRGRLGVARWLLEEYGDSIDFFVDDKGRPISVINEAAGTGNLELVKYLYGLRGGDDSAFKRRHGEEVRSSPPPCPLSAMDNAARKGHLEVVQWLHQHGAEGCTTFAIDRAAAGGHLKVIQWLHEHCSLGCTAAAMANAAESGHLAVVRWLHYNMQAGCSTSAMNAAAKNGHLDIVKWLHAHRTEGCSTGAMDLAAASGALDVVKWLHANRSEGCTPRAMQRAARYGHLNVVKWLHANRSTDSAAGYAMDSNSFEVLLFLHHECHLAWPEERAQDSFSLLENMPDEVRRIEAVFRRLA